MDSFPVIHFNRDTIDLGQVDQGQIIGIYVPFANIGNKDLNIELVTSCKCTQLEWPIKPVPPNYQSEIFLEFDSTDFEGPVVKVVDIIADTELIVTEFWFRATVIKASD